MSLEVECLRSQLDDEARKKQQQREENARRKHNYIPFISQLVGSLGEKDVLLKLMQDASAAKAEAASNKAKK